VPKSSRKEEQKHKEQILDILKVNAKATTREIAQKVGLSRQQVWKIIKKLEKDRTIWGYTPILDPPNLNTHVFMILIKSRPSIDYDILTQEINAFHDVPSPSSIKWLSVYHLHGNYDWVVIFTAKNIVEAKRAEDWIKKRYGKYIQEYILEEVIFSFAVEGVVNPNLLRDIKRVFS
jgi:DNA-binding Lrp family transcriptional regulator